MSPISSKCCCSSSICSTYKGAHYSSPGLSPLADCVLDEFILRFLFVFSSLNGLALQYLTELPTLPPSPSGQVISWSQRSQSQSECSEVAQLLLLNDGIMGNCAIDRPCFKSHPKTVLFSHQLFYQVWNFYTYLLYIYCQQWLFWSAL